MRITLIYVGTTSERFYAEAAAEYEKRLGAFATVKSVCIKEDKIANEDSDALISKALLTEESRIKAAIPKGAYTAAMCIEGDMLSSEQLASHISNCVGRGVSELAFIIGSSHGLSEDLKKSCNMRFSMSKMTFPHMLARVMLSEQLYRAFTIINRKKYHK